MSDATAILDRLALAHALLSAGRTRFALARDQWDMPVQPEAPEAVQFCLAGAVCRAIFELESVPTWPSLAGPIFWLIQETLGCNRRGTLAQWHDLDATTEDALALLEECAARVNPK